MQVRNNRNIQKSPPVPTINRIKPISNPHPMPSNSHETKMTTGIIIINNTRFAQPFPESCFFFIETYFEANPLIKR